MPTTQQFEFLLDRKNVIGVVWDEDDCLLEVRVSQKVPVEDLPDDDVIENALERRGDVPDVDVDVVDEGFGEERPGYDTAAVAKQAGGETAAESGPLRQQKQRPVAGGLSTGHHDITAGSAGPLAIVTDTDAGKWGDVSEGDLVRLSNNHIYAQSNKASLGDTIIQPAPMDGGSSDTHAVGELAGYLPVEDGVVADVAARTASSDTDVSRFHALPSDYGSSVHRSGQSNLKGTRVIKSGRTTGVLESKVTRTGASVRVNYGEELGVVKFRDQVFAESFSAGGDSGSPVFAADGGEFVGLNFAGSDNISIFNYTTNVESMGVEIAAPSSLVEESITNGITDVQSGEVAIPIVLSNDSLSDVTVGVFPQSTDPARVVTGEHFRSVSGALYSESFPANTRERAMLVYQLPDDVSDGDTVRLSATVEYQGLGGAEPRTLNFQYEVVESLASHIGGSSFGSADALKAVNMYERGELTESQGERLVSLAFGQFDLGPREWEA